MALLIKTKINMNGPREFAIMEELLLRPFEDERLSDAWETKVSIYK